MVSSRFDYYLWLMQMRAGDDDNYDDDDDDGRDL
jgi:hypothetical protein